MAGGDRAGATRSGRAPELSIGDVASITGVGESTLRMWEARYAFPQPRRLPSGHRRYSERDLARIEAVLRAREQGLPLPIAISRAQRQEAEPRPSIFSALRQEFSHLQTHVLPHPALTWLSHAIEDECCARAPRPLLFACFQHEAAYRRSEARWRELAHSAARAFVLADFPHLRRPPGGPIEIPIVAGDPLTREWVVVVDAPELCACLVGWERPGGRDGPRVFETIWTIEPEVVREAARLCCDLAARRAPAVVGDLAQELADVPPPGGEAHLRAAVELATRVTLYASAGT